jgi:Tol biopolymer transport system component
MTTLPDAELEAMDLPEPAEAEAPRFWPEAIRQEARVDQFPWPTVAKALLPGAIAIFLLLIPFALLRQQAARKIVYVDRTGQIMSVRADQENRQIVRQSPFHLSPAVQNELIDTLSALGLPQWSPDGRKLAITAEIGGNVRVIVFTPGTRTPVQVSSLLAPANRLTAPGDGWSPDSQHLAVLELNGERPILSIVDLTEEEPVVILVDNLSLDRRAGLSWHPAGEQLLVTTLADGTSPSTLHIVNVDGQSEPFVPRDNQLLRTDAVWSPDGQFIAYIVVDSTDSENPGLQAGELWLADADSGQARRLVAEGLNMAPIWHEADPASIYFTRYLTATAVYQLYRVNASGAPREVSVGRSSEALMHYPAERARFQQWSDSAPLLTITSQPSPSINQNNWTSETVIRATIRQSLPVLGIPQWSPDGQRLIATIWQDGRIQPALFNRNLQPQFVPASTFEVMAVPADGWSTSGQTLTLLEADGSQVWLTLFNPTTVQATPYDFIVDVRAGLNWHPTDESLLITGYTEDDPTPGLYVVDGEGNLRPFLPNDGQLVRSDGAWSPDGLQVAYVAGQTYTATQDALPGTLWLADSSGNNARELVSDAQVLAPIWNPTGAYIYYTRFVDQTGVFELFRVAVEGQSPPEYVGPGTELVVLYPFDRSLWQQRSPNGQQLLFVGAGQLPPQAYLAMRPQVSTVSQVMPLAGAYRWAPDGRQFAGTILDEGRLRVALFRTPDSPAVLTGDSPDHIVMPGDGWSPDSSQLALIKEEETQLSLAVLDTIQFNMGTSLIPLDIRAGLSWHPSGSQVMFTGFSEGITPTLYLYNPLDNTTDEFIPNDNQTVRADGVWRPDGQRVVYVAHNNITDTVTADFHAGPLWIANRDGDGARVLVADGLNLAPMWDEARNRLLFTRFMTETNSFELFRMNPETGIMVRLGPSSSTFVERPLDRQLSQQWSPDGRRWRLPGGETRTPLMLYTADVDNTAVAPLVAQCNTANPFVVRWAPTNRAILAACPSGIMYLHWVDQQRANTNFPIGLYPAWQP